MDAAGVIKVVLPLLLSAPSSALGHSFEHPKHDSVRIEGHTLTVEVTYAIPPGNLARRTRSGFDQDSDGKLSETEKKRLHAYLRTSALHFLKIDLNRKTVKWAEPKEKAALTVAGEDEPTSSSSEIVAELVLTAKELPIKKGENTLSITDRHKDGSVEVPLLVQTPTQTSRHLLTKREREIHVRFQGP